MSTFKQGGQFMPEEHKKEGESTFRPINYYMINIGELMRK